MKKKYAHFQQVITYPTMCYFCQCIIVGVCECVNDGWENWYRISFTLKSSFRKVHCGYNDLVFDYKLSLAHILNDLFHTIC
jgi:hypothetical protein